MNVMPIRRSRPGERQSDRQIACVDHFQKYGDEVQILPKRLDLVWISIVDNCVGHTRLLAATLPGTFLILQVNLKFHARVLHHAPVRKKGVCVCACACACACKWLLWCVGGNEPGPGSSQGQKLLDIGYRLSSSRRANSAIGYLSILVAA